MKGQVAEVLGFLDFSPEDLEHEIYGPDTNNFYRNLSIGRCQTDGYHIISKRYLQSPFRDSESYFRILTGLNEDDIHLILKQHISNLKHIKFLQVFTHSKTLLCFF